jgi:hypothetical protein
MGRLVLGNWCDWRCSYGATGRHATLRDTMRQEYKIRQPARWFLDYCGHIHALWKVMQKLSLPNAPFTGGRLRVSDRLQRGAGALQCGPKWTEREATTHASTELLRTLEDAQRVLWLDNVYWQHYGTTSVEENISQHVSELAVLVLDDVSTLHVAMRSVRFILGAVDVKLGAKAARREPPPSAAVVPDPNRTYVGWASWEESSSACTSSQQEQPDRSEGDLSDGCVSPAETDGLGNPLSDNNHRRKSLPVKGSAGLR